MRLSCTVALGLGLGLGAAGPALAGEDQPRHALPPSQNGDLVVGLCDGETSIEVSGVKPGDPMTREQAQKIADALMQEWRRKHPDSEWQVAAAESPGGPSGAAAAPPAAGQFQTYGAYTERDRQIWQDSTEKLVAEGKRIFHDAKALGGTDAISCDMCHPDASNTHPETYPKYQVQLGRVALLRDMINWCIENPVRGKELAADDPRMRALEAYITAQRTGTKMEYGKH
jgi:thiosulfate dehydrogenase